MRDMFRIWIAPLIGVSGLWARTYNELSSEQKEFYKEAHAVYTSDPTRFVDVLDYIDYKEHPLRYKVRHLWKGGSR